MKLIKITDLTNQLGISSRTLRYYEQVGLVQSVRLQFEKYRFYDSENIGRIKQIIVLRKMQIPIKDIISIYESEDMTVLVESFVSRINAIDNEIDALRDLKHIIDEFLQAMLKSGIKHISALPLLYEKIDKQLEAQEIRENEKEISFERLSDLSEKMSVPLDLIIIDLPPMRVLSSKLKDSDISDVDGFWDWLSKSRIPFGTPGSHKLFEYQKDNVQTVIIQNIDRDFNNDSPYSDYEFEGGLFAVGSVYVEDDIASFHHRMINSFDNNPYYEVDYRHGGRLRHESLAESVISSDSRREKINIFLPVKRRLPDAEHYDPNEQISNINLVEIEHENPVLYEYNIPLTEITPIYDPHYEVLETGEVEYICWIATRKLSTNVSVKIPFRVDIEFKAENESERFSYGSDEGSIRFYHGNNLFGINMENKADSRLSKEAICFNQPILGNYFTYPKLGRIKYNEYNTLTWIVGEKHFAVVINGEVRYCGVNFPYMVSDLYLQKPETIIIGSDGQGKKYFRAITVSQLKTTPKIKIKQGGLIMSTKQSNNIIPNIHQLITMHYGENYWFSGCAKYVMECLGEKDYNYVFFAGLTGDNFAQVYSYDRFRGDGATDYFLSDKGNTDYIENVFAACGYASTFITIKQLSNNKEMYLHTLIAYIDKGIPVIFNQWGNNPRNRWGWGVFVGYEDFGKTLLYMTADMTEPDKISFNNLLPDKLLVGQEACNGWVFVGEKRKNVELADIYRNRILTLHQLLTTKTESYCFGAEAFRSWATDIESGRFDNMKPEEFDDWPMYTIYVCNLATNSSCCLDFLDKAQELNPDLKLIGEIRNLYEKMRLMWNEQNGEDLEAIGGGFNITLGALQDKERRNKIVAKIREFAECTDKVLAVLSKGLNL
ncbi:MerR family transcriptional regulator [Desnuesiella massiliensis]|uniref:MerR family transcriptional regulator n=1 Tax=Desnuesiella massiliensis TaxID=1650662 RepID=UPI0006E16B3F|nr:MerR family transcriptional regulator [Desnuesiella massiliensis]